MEAAAFLILLRMALSLHRSSRATAQYPPTATLSIKRSMSGQSIFGFCAGRGRILPAHFLHLFDVGRIGFPQSRHFPVFRVQAGQGIQSKHRSQTRMGTSTTHFHKGFEYSFSLVENIFWSKSHRPKWLQLNPRTCSFGHPKIIGPLDNDSADRENRLKIALRGNSQTPSSAWIRPSWATCGLGQEDQAVGFSGDKRPCPAQ